AFLFISMQVDKFSMGVLISRQIVGLSMTLSLALQWSCDRCVDLNVTLDLRGYEIDPAYSNCKCITSVFCGSIELLNYMKLSLLSSIQACKLPTCEIALLPCVYLIRLV